MIPPTLCMEMLALAGTIAAPQNDKRGLCRFGIVWSHITKYQKGGVRLVLIIPPSCIMGCH